MDLRVLSYNCCGLRLGNSAEDRARRLVIDNLLINSDICLQETSLAQQDLQKLNSFNTYFHGAGESTTDFDRGEKTGC